MISVTVLRIVDHPVASRRKPTETGPRAFSLHLMARHRAPRTTRPRGSCRTGHLYGPGQRVGGGILRYLCSICGSVSIDITGTDIPLETSSLFVTAEGTLLST